MGNCITKPKNPGHRLGSSTPQPNPQLLLPHQPNHGQNNSLLQKSLATNSTRNSSTSPPHNTDDERKRRAEAAEKRALQNQGRGIVKNGPLAQKLMADRQLSDRALLERDAQANLASSANTSSGLHWTVNP